MLLLLGPLALAAPALGQEVCGSGMDDDRDGRADCADPDCAQSPVCQSYAGVPENTAERCANGVDDDEDGDVDCDDAECAAAFCGGTVPEGSTVLADPSGRPLPGTRGIYEPRTPEEERPDLGFDEHRDPRRYPQRFVEQPLTLLRGMLAPSMAFVGSRASDFVPELYELQLGVGYGLFDWFELRAVPLVVGGPFEVDLNAFLGELRFRLFDSGTVEMALSTGVEVPFRGTRNLDFRFARIDAELTFLVPLRIHFGTLARLDLVPEVDVAFGTTARGSEALVDIGGFAEGAFQLGRFAFVGLRTGLLTHGNDYVSSDLRLGFFAGATIPGADRGPVTQVAFDWEFPSLYRWADLDRSEPGYWRFQVKATVFTYLLP
ncbi:MAG: hypothetical protein ACFCGT_24055 [Sandaracinaceae bacterium]